MTASGTRAVVASSASWHSFAQARRAGFVLRRRGAGFTLLELVVVLTLITALLGVAWTAWRRPATHAVDAAQALLQSLIFAARTEAALHGGDSALLVCIAPERPDDFLRHLVVVRQRGPDWETVDAGHALPAGVGVLPVTALASAPPGAICTAPPEWCDATGAALRSTAWRAWPSSATPILGSHAWLHVRFSALGTTAGGDLWLAEAQPVAGGASATVRFINPEHLSGVSLSRYGAITVLNGRFDR